MMKKFFSAFLNGILGFVDGLFDESERKRVNFLRRLNEPASEKVKAEPD